MSNLSIKELPKNLNGSNPYNYAKISAQLAAQVDEKAASDPEWAKKNVEHSHSIQAHTHEITVDNDGSGHTHGIRASIPDSHFVNTDDHAHTINVQKDSKVVKMASTVVKVRSGPSDDYPVKRTLRKEEATYPVLDKLVVNGVKWLSITYSGWVKESEVTYQ